MLTVFIIVILGWILSVTFHEFCHAYIANEGGDTSVQDKGYLSLNPLKYINPMLTIILPIIFLIVGGLPLPGGSVYVNHSLLRNKYWASGVSLAGPCANLFCAMVLALVLHYAHITDTPFWAAISFLALLQIATVILNLIPIPGFDGFGIIYPFLPAAAQTVVLRFGMWGIYALIFALWFIQPVNDLFWNTVQGIAYSFGIPLDYALQGQALFMFWRHSS